MLLNKYNINLFIVNTETDAGLKVAQLSAWKHLKTKSSLMIKWLNEMKTFNIIIYLFETFFCWTKTLLGKHEIVKGLYKRGRLVQTLKKKKINKKANWT